VKSVLDGLSPRRTLRTQRGLALVHERRALGARAARPLLATTRASSANAITPAECRAGSGRAARAPRGRESSRGTSNMIVSSAEVSQSGGVPAFQPPPPPPPKPAVFPPAAATTPLR